MKHIKRIGIIFCGGCNCYFSREELYKEIVDNLGEKFSFSFYKTEDSHPYDMVVIINGCQSECLLSTDYDCPILLINNKNYENGVELIEKAASKL